MSFTFHYSRPGLSVEVCAFAYGPSSGLELLVVERDGEPYRGWASLPTTFVRLSEELQHAVGRALSEASSVLPESIHPLGAFDEVDRDPRERVISLAYLALIGPEQRAEAKQAARATWIPIDEVLDAGAAVTVPKSRRLAFDHAAIAARGRAELRRRVPSSPMIFELLPRRFTLTELQRAYERLTERDVDKRNFRRKLLSLDILVGHDEYQRNVAHRAAQYFSFEREHFQLLSREDADLRF